MTNEEEQITLNIDLYDNIMTEKEGDYTGRPRITGTLYNKQIAARIVKAGTEYKQESIEYILDRADKAKVEAIAEGKSVIDGVGQYLVTARGSFIGENAQFDPVKHSLGVSYTPGQLLRSQLKKPKSSAMAQPKQVRSSIPSPTARPAASTRSSPRQAPP